MIGPSHISDRVMASRSGAHSVRFHPRSLTVVVILLAATVVVGFVGLATGPTHVPFADVVPSAFGIGRPGDVFVTQDVRLPRLLLAVLVGAALGAGGGLFQSVANNPLGSPDIIGFDTGAATGAIIAIVRLGMTDTFGIAAAALIGGFTTAAIVAVLSFRGGVATYRLILVGIGAGALLSAVNTSILQFANVADAEHVALWLIGTLTGSGWDQVWPVAVAVVILLPLAGIASRGLALLEMGDPLARALGIGVSRQRLLVMACGVGLTAIATASTGPIGFVALAAPQLARRITGTSGPSIAASAAMGTFLLVSSDFVALRLLPQTELPVGIVTGINGGLYLVWLLAQEWRRNRI